MFKQLAVIHAIIYSYRAKSTIKKRQTFVFSATMMLGDMLKLSLSEAKKRPDLGKKRPNLAFYRTANASSSCLASLMKRIDFHDAKPKIINLSPKGIVAPNVMEFKIRCTNETKVSTIQKTAQPFPPLLMCQYLLGTLFVLFFTLLYRQIGDFCEFYRSNQASSALVAIASLRCSNSPCRAETTAKIRKP
jgi:hypothetical protein